MSIKKNMITYALYIDDELKAEGNAFDISDYLGVSPRYVYALYKRQKKNINHRKNKNMKIVRTDIFEDEKR